MRWPLVTRRWHNDEMAAARLVHQEAALHAGTQQGHEIRMLAASTTALTARAITAMIRDLAQAYVADADHMLKPHRTPSDGHLEPKTRRVIADELKQIADDVDAKFQQRRPGDEMRAKLRAAAGARQPKAKS